MGVTIHGISNVTVHLPARGSDQKPARGGNRKGRGKPAVAQLNAHAFGKPDWMPAVIALSGGDGPIHSAIAEVKGFFAVHPNISHARQFTLTHLPTGAAMPVIASKTKLKALADELAPLWDWSFTELDGLVTAPGSVREAVEAARRKGGAA